MGGHLGGEIASARTIERLRGVVEAGAVTPKAIEKGLLRAVKDIAAHPETTDEATGTTLTGVYLEMSGDQVHWVTLNIGDSRVYLSRDGVIAQITTDHSVVQELVAAGRLSPEEAENHPYGNVITRAVGPSDSVTPDYVRLDVTDGDRFVICSDGLTKELTDYGIQHFLTENADPPSPSRPCSKPLSRTAVATTSRSSCSMSRFTAKALLHRTELFRRLHGIRGPHEGGGPGSGCVEGCPRSRPRSVSSTPWFPSRSRSPFRSPGPRRHGLRCPWSRPSCLWSRRSCSGWSPVR